MKKLLLKFKETVFSVLPITLIVLILGLTIAPLESEMIWSFIVGAVFVIIGMSLFSLGAEISMIQMGEKIGASITKQRNIWLIVIVSFILGIIVTIAEPDLLVLAEQLSDAINEYVLIVTIGVGVGIFLVIALLRIVFQIKLRTLLLIFYPIVFLIGIFVPENFLSVAFDSGGVTTGPITVPFIMALGIGVASLSNKNNAEDSFGLIALCSIGPIISVFILGMFNDTSELVYDSVLYSPTGENILLTFIKEIPAYMSEVAIALAPVFVFFLIYQFAILKLPTKQLIKIIIGLVYDYIGLVIFLTGVNVGFLPAGNMIGSLIGISKYSWVLIPIGILVGFFIVAAEPAVHVLNSQVEEISGGTIKKRNMLIALMCGTGLSLAFSMIRVLTGISIWWFIVPVYAIAIILTFFVPKVFTSVAFDSGGVASGPMTATFLLPFAIGASNSLGGNIMSDAFGVVAMVAMTPLVTIQLMGLFYAIKLKKSKPTPYALPMPEKILEEGLVLNTEDAVIENGIIDFSALNNVETEIIDTVPLQENSNKSQDENGVIILGEKTSGDKDNELTDKTNKNTELKKDSDSTDNSNNENEK